MRNLTRTWMQVMLDGGNTKTQAVKALNQFTGRKYTLSRINEWLKGQREPDRETRVQMVWLILLKNFSRANSFPFFDCDSWIDCAEMLT